MAPSLPPNAEDPVEVCDTGRPHKPDPRFSIVDEADVPWTEVIVQQHGERRVSVHEKFLEWSPERMVVLGRYDPGMIIERHGHKSDHVIYILDGEVTVGDRVCTKGALIILEEGAVFGPLIAHPEQGCLMFETWLDDPMPVPADKEGYYALLESQGIVRLPNPTFEPPDHATSDQYGAGDRFS